MFRIIRHKEALSNCRVPQPSSFQREIANEKLKIYKATVTDQVFAETIQSGGDTLC